MEKKDQKEIPISHSHKVFIDTKNAGKVNFEICNNCGYLLSVKFDRCPVCPAKPSNDLLYFFEQFIVGLGFDERDIPKFKKAVYEGLQMEIIKENTDIQGWAEKQAEHFSTDKFGIAKDINFSLFEHLLPPKGSKILDIGCNSGDLTVKLTLMGYETYGVDLSKVLDKARSEFPYYKDNFLDCNLETDDLPDMQFDMVLALGVFEHIWNWDKFFAKVRKVLKLDGVFYFTTCNLEKIYCEQWHFRHFTKGDIYHQLRDYGFQYCDIVERGNMLMVTCKG